MWPVHTVAGRGERAKGTAQDFGYAASYGSARDESARQRASDQSYSMRSQARKGCERRSEPAPLDSNERAERHASEGGYTPRPSLALASQRKIGGALPIERHPAKNASQTSVVATSE